MGYGEWLRPNPPGYSDYMEWGTCCLQDTSTGMVPHMQFRYATSLAAVLLPFEYIRCTWSCGLNPTQPYCCLTSPPSIRCIASKSQQSVHSGHGWWKVLPQNSQVLTVSSCSWALNLVVNLLQSATRGCVFSLICRHCGLRGCVGNWKQGTEAWFVVQGWEWKQGFR